MLGISRDVILLLTNIFSDIIVLYFIVGNGVYTALMLMSFVSVWFYQMRIGYAGLQEVRESPVTPPVTIIVPAFNEERSIIHTVESLMRLDYPAKEIIVVDDGSTDPMLLRLIEHFQLIQMDLVYRSRLTATPPTAFYYNPHVPMLTVVTKPNGGKSDALNVGINMTRSPYFCTVDADCILEKDALLRLMHPVIKSPVNTVLSAGIVRILNGCVIKDGQVTEIRLPSRAVERFQVIEYLRSFLFGRTGWNLLNATFIASGAFCIFHRETAIDAGGFSSDTVAEDVDIVCCIHRDLRVKKRKYRMSFTTDPVCWTAAPHNLRTLGRQRRRWQLGLVQTVMKHNWILFNWRFGTIGLLSMPFQAFVEAFGCLVEFGGYTLIPITFFLGLTPLYLFLLLILLAFVYGGLLSVGSVLLEEITYRRYPKMGDLLRLLLYAVLESIGYRQVMMLFRVQGFLQYVRGKKKWETVPHFMRTEGRETLA
ncbi:MAG: glycosyltransferase [Acidobacteria bacterium]|nr:glycosyltransferase [Acidobacteriota bacterium]